MAMRRHRCDTCSREVLVEKFSEAHTSIQWSGDSSGCPLIASGGTRPGDHSRECVALRDSIDRAAAAGLITESRVELPSGADIPRLH